jgi:hypothetical protein
LPGPEKSCSIVLSSISSAISCLPIFLTLILEQFLPGPSQSVGCGKAAKAGHSQHLRC